jgi:hypothetical protein
MSDAVLTVQNIRTYTLIAAIANAIAGVAGTIGVLAAGASTFGCGCVLIVFPILHTAACIIDFIAYSKLGQPPEPTHYSTLRTSAFLDLASGFAVVPLIMGIMKLQLLNTEQVRRHFGVSVTA